jgi:haloalkane dehalogenase
MCLIWGMRDWCFSPHFLQRFQEYFPQAEVHPIEDAGHYVVEDAHERIIPILDSFLSDSKE